jgi:hypothetical protein
VPFLSLIGRRRVHVMLDRIELQARNRSGRDRVRVADAA